MALPGFYSVAFKSLVLRHSLLAIAVEIMSYPLGTIFISMADLNGTENAVVTSSAIVGILVCPLKFLLPSILMVAHCLLLAILLAHLLHQLHIFLAYRGISATMF